MNIHDHVANGDTAAVAAALTGGVSIEAYDEQGRTPLMVAAASVKASSRPSAGGVAEAPRKVIILPEEDEDLLHASAEDAPIIRFVNSLIFNASKEKAGKLFRKV